MIGGRRKTPLVWESVGPSLNPKQGQPTTATAIGNARGKPRGSIGIRTQHAERESAMEDEVAATANAAPTETASPGPTEPKGRGKTQPSDHPASDAPKSEPSVASDAQSAAPSVDSTIKKPASTSARMNPRGEPKKPSPRVRKSADEQLKKKADKRKSASAGKQTNATMSAATNAGTSNSNRAKETKEPQESTDNEAAMQTAASQTRGSGTELLPGQDNELRKEYLHRIYHQLRITHQNQNDEVLRQIATNIEMDVCLKATSRNAYILALNQQIQGLIQADVARTAHQPYSDTSSGPSPSSTPGHPPSSNRFQSDASNPKTRIIAYTQTQAPYVTRQTQVQTQTQDPYMNQNGHQQRQPSEGSFVHSLLSNQNPMQAYEQSDGGSSEMHGFGSGSMAMNGLYYNQNQGRVTPNGQVGSQSTMEMHMHQQSYIQQRQARQQPLVTTLQEFAVQVQHFDKSQMIELLWSQRNSLLQWQRRANQLEMQLSLQHQASANMGMNGVQGGYYNGPSAPVRQMQQPPATNVSSNVSSEAELQRENERRSARAWQEQQQYQSYSERSSEYAGAANSNPQTPVGSTPLPSMHVPGTNPSLYWKKVQTLKSAYARELYFAHRALSQHNAPPNSAQSNKADNVKHNIGVAMSVLNETPKAIQPRPFDVLDAIERFILNTVIPIVRKVQSGMASHSQSMVSPSTPAGELSVQAGQDPSKEFIGGRMPVNNNISPNSPRLPGMPTENESHQSSLDVSTKMQNSSSASLIGMTSTSSSSQYYSPESAPVTLANEAGNGRDDELRKPKPNAENSMAPIIPVQGNSNGNSRAIVASEAKENLKADSRKVNPSMDDNMNDFSDFPDLDFEDDLADMATSKLNKENSSAYNPKKRSIADI